MRPQLVDEAANQRIRAAELQQSAEDTASHPVLRYNYRKAPHLLNDEAGASNRHLRNDLLHHVVGMRMPYGLQDVAGELAGDGQSVAISHLQGLLNNSAALLVLGQRPNASFELL